MNHTADIPINQIWSRTAITAGCWRWCTQLAQNHRDYSTHETNEFETVSQRSKKL